MIRVTLCDHRPKECPNGGSYLAALCNLILSDPWLVGRIWVVLHPTTKLEKRGRGNYGVGRGKE